MSSVEFIPGSDEEQSPPPPFFFKVTMSFCVWKCILQLCNVPAHNEKIVMFSSYFNLYKSMLVHALLMLVVECSLLPVWLDLTTE